MTIDKIIEKIPYCSLLTDNDEKLYQKFIEQKQKDTPHTYAQSWIFIQQIAQGNCLKYFNAQLNHLITIAPNWGSQKPNYLYLPLGRDVQTSIVDLSRRLAFLLKEDIFVKKIYSYDIKNNLMKQGFQDCTTIQSLNFTEAGDDQYPEVICDVETIIKAGNNIITDVKMRRFRRSMRKLGNIHKIYPSDFSEKILSMNIEDDFKRVVVNWAMDIATRITERSDINGSTDAVASWMSGVYYPYFLKRLIPYIQKEKLLSYVTYLKGKAVAFTSAYPVSNECLAVNANICDTSIGGLSQYQIFRLAQRASDAGYRYLNLGSNDIKTQYDYKSDMGKIFDIDPIILKYKYNNKTNNY